MKTGKLPCMKSSWNKMSNYQQGYYCQVQRIFRIWQTGDYWCTWRALHMVCAVVPSPPLPTVSLAGLWATLEPQHFTKSSWKIINIRYCTPSYCFPGWFVSHFTKSSWKIINIRYCTLISDLFAFSCKMEYTGLICNLKVFSFCQKPFFQVSFKEFKPHH